MKIKFTSDGKSNGATICDQNGDDVIITEFYFQQIGRTVPKVTIVLNSIDNFEFNGEAEVVMAHPKNAMIKAVKKIEFVDGELWEDGKSNYLQEKYTELQKICAEAYQVIGVLSNETGRFDDAKTVKILDNLSELKMIHNDVLPYPSITK